MPAPHSGPGPSEAGSQVRGQAADEPARCPLSPMARAAPRASARPRIAPAAPGGGPGPRSAAPLHRARSDPRDRPSPRSRPLGRRDDCRPMRVARPLGAPGPPRSPIARAAPRASASGPGPGAGQSAALCREPTLIRWPARSAKASLASRSRPRVRSQAAQREPGPPHPRWPRRTQGLGQQLRAQVRGQAAQGGLHEPTNTRWPAPPPGPRASGPGPRCGARPLRALCPSPPVPDGPTHTQGLGQAPRSLRLLQVRGQAAQGALTRPPIPDGPRRTQGLGDEIRAQVRGRGRLSSCPGPLIRPDVLRRTQRPRPAAPGRGAGPGRSGAYPNPLIIDVLRHTQGLGQQIRAQVRSQAARPPVCLVPRMTDGPHRTQGLGQAADRCRLLEVRARPLTRRPSPVPLIPDGPRGAQGLGGGGSLRLPQVGGQAAQARGPVPLDPRWPAPAPGPRPESPGPGAGPGRSSASPGHSDPMARAAPGPRPGAPGPGRGQAAQRASPVPLMPDGPRHTQGLGQVALPDAEPMRQGLSKLSRITDSPGESQGLGDRPEFRFDQFQEELYGIFAARLPIDAENKGRGAGGREGGRRAQPPSPGRQVPGPGDVAHVTVQVGCPVVHGEPGVLDGALHRKVRFRSSIPGGAADGGRPRGRLLPDERPGDAGHIDPAGSAGPVRSYRRAGKLASRPPQRCESTRKSGSGCAGLSPPVPRQSTVGRVRFPGSIAPVKNSRRLAW